MVSLSPASQLAPDVFPPCSLQSISWGPHASGVSSAGGLDGVSRFHGGGGKFSSLGTSGSVNPVLGTSLACGCAKISLCKCRSRCVGGESSVSVSATACVSSPDPVTAVVSGVSEGVSDSSLCTTFGCLVRPVDSSCSSSGSLDAVKSSSRIRASRTSRATHSQVRVASVNVGAISGWRDGVLVVMELMNLDILFILDTRLQSTPLALLGHGCDIHHTSCSSTRHSSMLVVTRINSGWKVSSSSAHHLYGCHIQVSDGRNRVRGVYLRPSEVWNTDLDRVAWCLKAVSLDSDCLVLGDFNARHPDWDRAIVKAKPRGNWLKHLVEKAGARLWSPDTPTFVRGPASSVVDLALAKNFALHEIVAIDTKLDRLLPADHRLIRVVAYRLPRSVDQPSVLSHSAGKNLFGIARINSMVSHILEKVDTGSFSSAEELFVAWKDALHSCFAKRMLSRRSIFLNKACRDAIHLYESHRSEYDRITTPSNSDKANAFREVARVKRDVLRDAKRVIRETAALELARARPGLAGAALSLIVKHNRRREVKADKAEFMRLLGSKSGVLDTRRVSARCDSALLPPEYRDMVLDKLSNVKKKKSPGVDGIVSEAIVTHKEEAASLISEIAHCIMKEGVVPLELATANIFMVPKTEEPSVEARDYRPVACQSQIRKILEAPVARKINECWTQTRGQHGFTAGSGSEIASIIIHEELAKKSSHRLVGLDLAGAFDAASIDTIVTQIAELPMDCGWRRLAEVLVTNSTRMVMENNSFWTRNGVPQGGTLSPTLFKLLVDTLLVRLRSYESVERDSGLPEPTVVYADDVSLVIDLHDTTRAQARLDICSQWALDTASSWNVSKCWVLLDSVDPDPALVLSGRPIPVVRSAQVMGIPFNAHGIDSPSLVRARIDKAQRCLTRLRGLGLFTSRPIPGPNELPVVAALTLYKSYVRSILEYGCRLLILDSNLVHELDEFQNRALQEVCSVNATQSIHGLREALRVQEMGDRLRELRLVAMATIQKPVSRGGNCVLDTLGELHSPLVQPLSIDQFNLASSKVLRLHARQAIWGSYTKKFKIRAPILDGLPPALKTTDVSISRWILKWFCGRPTNNLTSDQQNSILPDFRSTIKNIITSPTSWTREVEICNLRILRKSYRALHKIVACNAKNSRSAVLPSSFSPSVSNSGFSLETDCSSAGGGGCLSVVTPNNLALVSRSTSNARVGRSRRAGSVPFSSLRVSQVVPPLVHPSGVSYLDSVLEVPPCSLVSSGPLSAIPEVEDEGAADSTTSRARCSGLSLSRRSRVRLSHSPSQLVSFQALPATEEGNIHTTKVVAVAPSKIPRVRRSRGLSANSTINDSVFIPPQFESSQAPPVIGGKRKAYGEVLAVAACKLPSARRSTCGLSSSSVSDRPGLTSSLLVPPQALLASEATNKIKVSEGVIASENSTSDRRRLRTRRISSATVGPALTPSQLVSSQAPPVYKKKEEVVRGGSFRSSAPVPDRNNNIIIPSRSQVLLQGFSSVPIKRGGRSILPGNSHPVDVLGVSSLPPVLSPPSPPAVHPKTLRNPGRPISGRVLPIPKALQKIAR